MYVAVKGGERAIEEAHRLLAEARRGDQSVTEISLAQIEQARGDLLEAIFLLRAYRTTLPRFAVSEPIDTAAMVIRRRVSAIFKDLPGGQILGPTFDYTHRLLDFDLGDSNGHRPADDVTDQGEVSSEPMPRVVDLLDREGLIETEEAPDDSTPVDDLTREPLRFPASRGMRLQNLARGDEGFLLALGYSTQRGYGRNHPFAGEIRLGEVEVEVTPAELGFAIAVASIEVTECQMVNQFKGSATAPPQFTRGYGLAFGEA